MFYQNELQFLCDTFRKSRVQVFSATQEEFPRAAAELGIDGLFGNAPSKSLNFPEDAEPYTVYQFTDADDLSYLYLLLPETEKPTVLVIGPFLKARFLPERLLELGKRRGLSPKQQTYLEEYVSGISVLLPGNHLFIMLSAFCERIWKRPAFSIVDVEKKDQASDTPINEPMHNEKFDDVLINMKMMDRRYAFENELIQAVSLGQIHKENELLSAFSEQLFEQRLNDPLRNAKNYGIIMNTLLRKAAESGGVHPVYIDRMSSEFAAKIERMPDLSENSALMCEMFRSYCRLVRQHALIRFSLVVQKTILLIDSDLSANLSLQSLAEYQNVSAGYLSSVFKKETGKTVCEYIREKRMKHAAFLLATTHQQIQTVALHCGIMDVQYFSKIFKKVTGKTPKEYREASHYRHAAE